MYYDCFQGFNSGGLACVYYIYMLQALPINMLFSFFQIFAYYAHFYASQL